MKVQCIIILNLSIILHACNGADARKISPDPKERVQKNIEEGRGFRLMGGDKKGGTFDFASSNELWRASLDTIDFMPLASANYSGGIIITDWYSDETNSNESIKITIRFFIPNNSSVSSRSYYRPSSLCAKTNRCHHRCYSCSRSRT